MISLGRLMHKPLYEIETWPVAEIQMQQAYDYMQTDDFKEWQEAKLKSVERSRQLELSAADRAKYVRDLQKRVLESKQ